MKGGGPLHPPGVSEALPEGLQGSVAWCLIAANSRQLGRWLNLGVCTTPQPAAGISKLGSRALVLMEV